ncbi:hypothetical protein EBZ80_21775 [bacterium]|nr:hypothetical protein [bacterium]
MFLGKNNENIYGYTGKKTPTYNFAPSRKAQVDLKPKPVVLRSGGGTEKKRELLVNRLVWETDLDLSVRLSEAEELPRDIMGGLAGYLERPLILRTAGGDSACTLLPHEKGVSVRLETFDVQAVIRVDGDHETIRFVPRNDDVAVAESRIAFSNPQFPFFYIYEADGDDDGIFRDFITTNLPEIRPPAPVVVPALQTKKLVRYRQHIGYLRTSLLMNLRVDEQGWSLDSFTESGETLVNGVRIEPKPVWIYHPRGTRIEHHLYFG